MRSISCFVFVTIVVICTSCSRERPFGHIEGHQWLSIEAEYCVGAGPEVRGCLEIKCLKKRVATIAVFWVFVKTPMFFWETAFV